MCSTRSGYYIGDEKQERRIHTERREKLKEDQRKTKAEDKRKPMERILANLEAKKKEEIIKSTGHQRPHVTKQHQQPIRYLSLNFRKIT